MVWRKRTAVLDMRARQPTRGLPMVILLVSDAVPLHPKLFIRFFVVPTGLIVIRRGKLQAGGR